MRLMVVCVTLININFPGKEGGAASKLQPEVKCFLSPILKIAFYRNTASTSVHMLSDPVMPR